MIERGAHSIASGRAPEGEAIGSGPGPSLRAVLVAAGVALAAASVFYCVLLFDGSLHGYDWKSHHWNYFDWVRASLSDYRTLPLFMNDAWITKNFLANAEAPSLGPLVWLLFALSTDAYLKLLLVLFTAAGLVGMWLLGRDLGVSTPVACAAASAFAFGGFFVSHLSVGHPWVMGGLILPGLLWLYRRAALGSDGALVAAAASNAFTIGGGQHQPFIWQNLLLVGFAVGFAVRARAWFPLTRLALLLALTVGLGAVKLLPMLAEFADYDPSARVQGLPPGLLLAALAGRGQHPDLQVPALPFAHGGGWWEYAFYLGPVALAFVVAGVLAARRCFTLLAIGCFFLLLAIEWSGPLRWLGIWGWLEPLPVWRTQRGPSRFLFLTLFCFTVVAAVGVQRLWDEYAAPRLRGGGRRWGRLALWALTPLIAIDLFVESLPWQRAAVGPPLESRDHRPKPLRPLGTDGGSAALVEFAPNRLVYHLTPPAPGVVRSRVVFPFRLADGTREWRVDGLPASREGNKLALDLPSSERDVAMTYRPAYFHLGAAVSAVSVLALAITATWRSRLR